MDKPPIGMQPRRIWVADRIADLCAAISRYASQHSITGSQAAAMEAWLEELAEHVKWICTPNVSEGVAFSGEQRKNETRKVSVKKPKWVGEHYVGLCPFHHEETPSFTVYLVSGRYRCFGCGAVGYIGRRERDPKTGDLVVVEVCEPDNG